MEYFKLWLSNLTFTALSLPFGGHEASLFHAFRVIILFFNVIWSVMSYSSSVGNYFCFSLIVYATVPVVHFLLQVPKARLQFQN